MDCKVNMLISIILCLIQRIAIREVLINMNFPARIIHILDKYSGFPCALLEEALI